MTNPTPSPAPQQWAKPYTEIQELAQAIRRNLQDDACPYVQDDKWVITAAAHALVILDNVELATKHAAALIEENERLKREVELQTTRVIEREERLEQMATSWDATKAQLTTLRLWSEQAREAMADAERYLVEHGCSHEYPVLINLRALLASRPAQGMEGRG